MNRTLGRFLYTLLVCLVAKVSFGQVVITTPDTTICPGTNVTLNAIVNGRVPNGITLNDDAFTGVVPIGFSFTYFGNTYTDCIISSNGYIKFGSNGQANGYSAWTINSGIPGNTDVTNSIMAFYADTDPGVSGTLDYAVMGTAPNRKFVVSFCDVAMFSSSCNSLRASFQIVLYETSNNIEIHIANAPNCPSWNGGYAIEGIQNSNGTVAYEVPGRNYPNQWTATQSSHRFEPTGPNSYNVVPIPFSSIPNALATITWLLNGVQIGTGPSITVSPGVQSTYQARVTNCQDTLTDDVTVFIDNSVTADFSFDINYGCSQDTVKFTNLSANATFSKWDFGDGTGGIITNPEHIYLNQGTYSVKLVASRGSCKDSITKQVNTQHPLNAEFTVSDDSVCQGTVITFTNSSNYSTIGGPATFAWDFGDGNTSTQMSPTHSYADPGIYTATLIVKDFVPCTDTFTRTIVVDSLPFLGFSASDSSFCEGQGVTFIADYSSNGLTGFIWNFGDGTFVPDVDQVIHAFDSAGIFTVALTGQYRVCPDITVTKPIEVRPFPTINLGPDTTLCLNGAGLVISDLTNFTNPSARWIWNTGDSNTNTIIARHEGIYTARVTLNGCSASDTVEVRKDCYIDIPNAFSPNGDGNNDYFLPRALLAKGVTTFKMTIYNRWGQEVFTTTQTDGRGWDGRFNGKEQPEGVYIYMIEVMLKTAQVEKFQGNLTLLR